MKRRHTGMRSFFSGLAMRWTVTRLAKHDEGIRSLRLGFKVLHYTLVVLTIPVYFGVLVYATDAITSLTGYDVLDTNVQHSWLGTFLWGVAVVAVVSLSAQVAWSITAATALLLLALPLRIPPPGRLSYVFNPQRPPQEWRRDA